MNKALENNLGNAQRRMGRKILGITLRDRKNAKLIRTQIRLEDSSTVKKREEKVAMGLTNM